MFYVEHGEAMKQKNFIDKSKFEAGPWQSEADIYCWTDSETGYNCVIWRNPEMGNLCGYVGVPSGHPLFEKNYDDEEAGFLQAHGGLTFSDYVGAGTKENAEDFKPDLWYFGFDCAHAWDITPYMYKHMKMYDGECFDSVYRNFEYVEEQIKFLAGQLKNYK